MPHVSLGIFHRCAFLLEIPAYVVLLTFTWLLLYPTVLTAQTLPRHHPEPAHPRTPSAEDELAEALATLEAQLTRRLQQRTTAVDTPFESQDLTVLRTRLEKLDARIRQRFGQIEQHLKTQGFPAEILQRHQEMVATYDTDLATLLCHLNAIATAENERARQDRTTQLLQHLKVRPKSRPHQPVNPTTLPVHVPDGKVRKPRETTKEFHSSLLPPSAVRVAATELPPGVLTSAQATAPRVLPTPDDLAPTEDVQMTEDIKALAATLGNNPVKIFNWVRDHIDFLPTYGAIQGAQMTLQTKRGNAFDTASLLIALLRAANIPARYVLGTVQIPLNRLLNWVGGVIAPEVALQLLSQGGIPNTALISGGQIVAVKLEHVWVEGYVDFEPSRGAVHRQGDTWVPMDASFKQYTITPGMDLKTRVPFDVQGFVAQATQGALLNPQEGWIQHLHQANIRTFLTAYQQHVQQFVVSHKPNATLDEMLGARTIIAEPYPMLAGGLPYHLVVRGTTFAALPASLRHHVSVALYTSALDLAQEEQALHYQMSLPALHTQRLGVTYMPATEADRQLINSYKHQGATSLPAYLLRVTPLLQLDGRTVATGPVDTMGRRHVWSVTLRDPHEQYTRTEQFTGSAGDELVFGVNGNGLTEAVLRARLATHASDTAAENLSTISLCYWLLYDLEDQLTAKLTGVAVQRLPSVGLFAVPLRVTYLFGIPRTGAYHGRRMDVARSLLAVAGPDAAQVVAFRQQSGWQGSYLEGAVFDMVLGHPQGSSISAVQLLQEAHAQGIPLYRLTSQNLPGALPHLQLDPDVQQDIITAVDTGKTVVVSAREVVRDRWSGVGYVIQDPATGAGAYLIQGGVRGGEEDPCREDSLEPEPHPIADIIFVLSLFILLVALAIAFAELLPVWALAAAGGVALGFDVAPIVAWPVPTNEQGLWNALFAQRFGPLLTQPPFPGDGLGEFGTCGEEYVKSFGSIIHGACDEQGGGSRECRTAARARDCPAAAQFARNEATCIELRLQLMFTCFNGGDEDHWGQVSQRLRGLFRCICLMDINGCPPAFRLP